MLDRIKDEYRLLNQSNQETTLTVSDSFAVNKQTSITRFSTRQVKEVLESNQKCLGHRVGQYVELQVGGDRVQAYPLSRIDDAGFVDLAFHRSEEAKNPNNLLIDLPKGSTIKAKGPYRKWLYQGHGKFLLAETSKQFRYVGLVAEGNAMCNFFSLVEAIATNNDHTSLSLLWHCQTREDFFLLEQLNYFVGRQKLALNLTAQKPDRAWLGPIGQVTDRHLQNFMPYPTSNCLILTAGSPTFTSNVTQQCKQLGFKDIFS